MSKKIILFLCMAVVGFVACERKGPAERAGEKVDNTVERAADSVEDAGDRVKDAAEDMKH